MSCTEEMRMCSRVAEATMRMQAKTIRIIHLKKDMDFKDFVLAQVRLTVSTETAQRRVPTLRMPHVRHIKLPGSGSWLFGQ